MSEPLYPFKSSFSGGEFAPSLYARIDIQKYASGARKLRNFFVHPHGGISNRPGLEYIAKAKNNNETILLQDFQFASDENYVLEFGNYYCRFYKDGAQLEKTTGPLWTASVVYALNDLTYASQIVYRCLQAHTSAAWATDLAALKWQVDINKWIATTAYIAGDYVAVGTATPAIYYCIQNHTSGTAFTAGTAWLGQTIYEVVTPYSASEVFSLRFAQSADVLFIVHPEHHPQELARYSDTYWALTDYAYLYGSFGLPNDDLTFTMKLSALTGSATLTSSAAFFYPTHADSLFQLTHYIEGQSLGQSFTTATESISIKCGGSWRVISHGTWTGKFAIERQNATGATNWTVLRKFSSENDFNVETYGAEDMSDGELPFSIRINAQKSTSGTFSGTLSIDLTSDPYEHIAVASITSYIDSKNMAVTMQRPAGSTATTAFWAEGAWSDYRGWPSTVTFFQDRLVFAGSSYYPQTIWASQTGDYYNFFINSPLTASDAISTNLPAQKLNQINGLVSLLQLLTFSSGAEFSVGSTEGGIFSPISLQTKLNGYTGSSGIQPVVIVNRAIYVQSRGSVIRDLGYDLFTDTFTGSNLSILSNHLFSGYNITQMCYQQEPDSLVWAVRDDGKLLCMTYMREQEVLAWTWCDTNEGTDKFESVCSIPGDGYNEVWASVNRGGQRYIERMAERMKYSTRENQFFVDCGVTFDAPNTPDASTKLLMHCDTDSFTDEIGNVVSNHNGVLLDIQKTKFGTGSALFTGTRNYLSVADSADWHMGTGNFTIEFYAALLRTGTLEFFMGQFADDDNYWALYKDEYDKLGMGFCATAIMQADYVMKTAYPFLTGEFYHFRFVRDSTKAYIFINGVSQGLTINTYFLNNDVGDIASALSIGSIA